MKNYFEQDVLESLLKIELPMKYRVKGHRKGTHKSNISGKNVDFKEHREYVQGDDVSKIDWKLFGRTEKLYIKEYEEDVSCNVLVIIDKSASMKYTSGHMEKVEYAKFLFTTIFTVFTRQGDNVGLGFFDEKFKMVLPPSSQSTSIPRLNEILNGINAEGKTVTENINSTIQNSLKKKINMIYIISDFIVNSNAITAFISGVKSFSNDVYILQLSDPVEKSFDFKGEYLFKDYETGKEIILNSSDISDFYKSYYSKHIEEIRKISKKNNCQYFNLSTKYSYPENFMKFVSHYTRS